jgi:preprotein translocase subunit SecA
LMERLKVDDSLPLEARLVGSVIEQSQHRIEGANFDVRKHLLEYDDVLNQQRAQIYSQRDRIFVKEDLSEDVAEMLEVEIKQRVSGGLADEEGPWKLLAWLEEVQPPFMTDNRLFPSFGLSLLLKELANTDDLRQATLNLLTRAIDAENEHHLNAISQMIDRTEEAFEAQIESRMDSADTYFDGLRDVEETPRPQKMLEEVNALTGVPVKLSNEQLRTFGEDIPDAKELIKAAITAQLTAMYASRLIAAIQNRIGDGLAEKFEVKDWADAANLIEEAAKNALARRRERLVGENGQIANDIDGLLPSEINDTTKAQLLLTLSQGSRTVFDQRTHRQVKQVFTRFSYIFLLAQLLDGYDADELSEEVLTHVQEADESLRFAIGQNEFARISSNAQRLGDFGVPAKMAFGEDRFNESVAGLGESDREALIEAIGKYILNEIRRQLLLGATSELWVEYLTRIEALRVAISLEAYAQRDPLVQYKAKASELFAQLVEDIRGLVVSRAFAGQRQSVEITPVDMEDINEETQGTETDGNGKRRKRRRH